LKSDGWIINATWKALICSIVRGSLNMSDIERLREVEGALASGPDVLAFRAIRALLDSWPEGEGRWSGLRKVQTALAMWPDNVRTLETYWGELNAALDAPSWPLIRDLAIDISDSRPLADAVRERRLENLGARDAFSSLTRLAAWGPLPTLPIFGV
jgi:hypothetical protein